MHASNLHNFMSNVFQLEFLFTELNVQRTTRAMGGTHLEKALELKLKTLYYGTKYFWRSETRTRASDPEGFTFHKCLRRRHSPEGGFPCGDGGRSEAWAEGGA